jgi:hypothetical protein
MWWYREGNKEQGWRGVGYLTPSIVHILLDLCAFDCAISPLILLFFNNSFVIVAFEAYNLCDFLLVNMIVPFHEP